MKRQMACFAGLLLMLCWAAQGFAAPAGKITKLQGRVDITSPGTSARSANTGDSILVGDIIRTKSNAKAEIEFSDGSIIRLAPGSRVEINEYMMDKKQNRGVFNLFRGKIQNIVKKSRGFFGFGKSNRYEVHTPTAVCGVRGTDYFSSYVRGASNFIFKEGSGYGYNKNRPDQVMQIQAGQALTVIGADQPPVVRIATPAEIEQHGQDTAAPENGDKGGEKGDGKPGEQGDSKGQPDGDGNSDNPQGYKRADDGGEMQDRNPGPNDGQRPDDRGPGDDGRGSGMAGDRPEGDHHDGAKPKMARRGDRGGDYGPRGDNYRGDMGGDYGPHGNFGPGPGNFEGGDPMFFGPGPGGFEGGDPMFFGPGPGGFEGGDPMFFGPGPGGFNGGDPMFFKSGPDFFGPALFLADGSFNDMFMPMLFGFFGPDSYTLFDPMVLPWEVESVNPNLTTNYRLAGDWSNGYSIQLYGEWNTQTMQFPEQYIDIVEGSLDAQRYFYGSAGGVWHSGVIEGEILMDWIGQDGSAGVLTGDMAGSYAADGIWQSNWVSLDTIQLSAAGTATYNSSDPIPDPKVMYYDSSAGRTFNAGGGTIQILNPDGGFVGGFISVPGVNWGIYRGEVNGTFTGTVADNWKMSVEFRTPKDPPFERYHWAELYGSQWSGDKISGKFAGAWINFTSAVSGVMGGKLYGEYDPLDYSNIWDLVIGGTMIDTNKFLEMVGEIGGTPNVAALDKLKIPRFEIGRTNLAGNNGNLNVAMNNVIFFAYTAGQSPSIWAAKSVSGTYSDNPATGDQVLLNGAGFSSVAFNVERWAGSAGDKWAAKVNGSGTVGGYSVNMKGGAAGSIDSSTNFSGTGAGVAR